MVELASREVVEIGEVLRVTPPLEMDKTVVVSVKVLVDRSFSRSRR